MHKIDPIPLRRGQLVTTFGPGSLVVSTEGESMIVGALDGWYKKNNESVSFKDDYEIIEPRLTSSLGVKKLLKPPEYRSNYIGNHSKDSIESAKTEMHIPLLKFPSWHYCPSCKNLHQVKITSRDKSYYCKRCKQFKKMVQVPFVIVCNKGHISDFPWREWAHHDDETKCTQNMRLDFPGKPTLDSMKVVCDCGKKRSLKGVMSKRTFVEGEENVFSELSLSLNQGKNKYYTCPGKTPWFGSLESEEECFEYPLTVLKNSLNVYYPDTISAIHLPGKHDQEVNDILEIFVKHSITKDRLNRFTDMKNKISYVEDFIKSFHDEFSKEKLELAILYVEGKMEKNSSVIEEENLKLAENDIKMKEFETLCVDNTEDNNSTRQSLKIVSEWDQENESFQEEKEYFGLVNRITKLKETVVLKGFSRLNPDNLNTEGNINNNKVLLFIHPKDPENDWLLAHEVYGEGIFITLDNSAVEEWSEGIKDYFDEYLKRINKDKVLEEKNIEAKEVLMHTLSHLIINELAISCGYNSASINERLYVKGNQCGVLIYTSAGDMSGTLGGLVRMGRTEHLFKIIRNALVKAQWCSSDPVCSEIGTETGQGVNKLNGAACHSCSYLPETSCEMRNLFLDRALLLDSKVGFFKNYRNQDSRKFL